MKKFGILLIFDVLLLFGCQFSSNNSVLSEIDSLVIAEKYDSAHNILSSINMSDMYNEEDVMHFHLLNVQTAYLVNKPLSSSDSLLDVVITYYKQNVNKERLADAYYYKAICSFLNKNIQNSILYYKEAELLAEETDNLRQQYKIAEGISFVNRMSKQYDLELVYAKRSLKLAHKLDKKNWIAYSLYTVQYAYSNLGHEDSAYIYLREIPQYINYVDKKELPVLLTTLGFLLMENHPEEAKQYLKKSLSFRELTATYGYLAELSDDEGNDEEAHYYWEKALKVKDATPKDYIIQNLIKYDLEHGNIDRISNRVTEIIAIRDSIDALLRNDTIKDLQTRFDHEVAMNEKDQTIIKWQWGIFILIIIIFIFVGYYLRRKYLAKIKLQSYQMQIQDSMEQIRNLETANRLLKDTNQEQSQEFEHKITMNLKKIDELNKDIKDIMDNKAPRLDQGRMLYDDIVRNKKMKRWKIEDINKFLDYYSAVNYRKVVEIKNIPRTEKLTVHRLFYLILLEMGKTDEEILWIMSISKETQRVYRSRTKPL